MNDKFTVKNSFNYSIIITGEFLWLPKNKNITQSTKDKININVLEKNNG